MHRYQGQITR